MTPRSSTSAAPVQPSSPFGEGARLHVLLAEDDASHRARLRTLLQEAGYGVVEAATGEDALKAYVHQPTELVLLDTELKGLDGLEVCRRIRALDASRTTFVVVYSRHDTVRALLAALDAGADDYIHHPDNADIVRARLSIAHRRLLSEETRRAAEAEAARARYLAGVGEMAIALQHEINNPLAAILAHAELMTMDASDRGTSDESLATILEQARRIADVVRRLSSLRNPMSVEYVPGKRMVHLQAEQDHP